MIRLEDLGLSTKARNVLKRYYASKLNVYLFDWTEVDAEDLLALDLDRVRLTRGCGVKVLGELERAVTSLEPLSKSA